MENIYSVNYRIVHHAPFQPGCSAPSPPHFPWVHPPSPLRRSASSAIFLNSLLKSSPCDKASATSPLSQEEKHEIASEVRPFATQSRVARSQADRTSVGRTTQTRPRSGRAASSTPPLPARPQEVQMNPKLTNERLKRRAIVYLRQSSPNKCFTTRESTTAIWLARPSARPSFSRRPGDRQRTWDARGRLGGAPRISAPGCGSLQPVRSVPCFASRLRDWRGTAVTGTT